MAELFSNFGEITWQMVVMWLIGALLMDDQLAPYSLPELSIEHFRPELQPTFAAVQGFWITKGLLDIMQIAAKYPDQKQNLLSCVASCESECIRLTRDRVEEWTRIIMEDAAKARFQSLAFRAVDAATAFDDLPDLYQQMGQALDIHTEKNDFQSVGDLLDDYIRHLDEKPKYIRTGLSKLDENLHLVPGNYFVIGGRPSAGKTALSLQMAADMAAQGYKVCYFSLETDPNTLIERTISNRLRIPLHVVKNKNVSTDELDRLADVKKTPVYFRSAAGKGVGWIRTQSVRMRADIVFVDYLQLIHQAGAKDRYGAITEISIALHEFAQATHTLVIALAQLNRDTARTGAIPTSADLRESGQIEQDADAIILLASDVAIKDHPERKYYFGLAKNKEGDTGDLLITFNKPIQRFEEYEW